MAKPRGKTPKFDLRTFVLDSWRMSSFSFSVHVLNVFPGFWFLQHVGARRKYVPYFVIVYTHYVGDTMTRKRSFVCAH